MALNALGCRARMAREAAESGKGRPEFTSIQQWRESQEYVASRMEAVASTISEALSDTNRWEQADPKESA
jgi:hypothetical protein